MTVWLIVMWPTRNNRPRCPRAKKANNTIAKEKTFSVFITQRLEPYTACVRTTWSLTQSEGSLINNGIEIIGLQRLIIIRSWIGEGHKQTFRIRLTGKKEKRKSLAIMPQRGCFRRTAECKIHVRKSKHIRTCHLRSNNCLACRKKKKEIWRQRGREK